MWITWKIIVRETCFFEEIQAGYTVSWVLQKYFNFVPMLESRNVDHMTSNCSDITVPSVFQNYFIFVLMLESRNMYPSKIIFSCDLFCAKIEADITVSWNLQDYFNFLPTLQLQLRNVSQLKDNVHETHLFWKYPTYVAVLSFFNYFNCLPMLEWFKLGLLLFRLISSNCQLTRHSSNGS